LLILLLIIECLILPITPLLVLDNTPRPIGHPSQVEHPEYYLGSGLGGFKFIF